MKIKSIFFIICLIAVLPFTLQGVLDSGSGSTPVGPKMRVKTPSVVTETEPGLIHLTFTRDLGVVDVNIQDADGITVLNRSIHTSFQNQETFSFPAGEYIVTVTNADGVLVSQTYVIVP